MLVQRRIQELAVRCIQRNVRAFLKVRGWPWWRLLVRVTPLLNVHRTEEQLKSAIGELQILKIKLEKSETERNNLKAENSKLESRLSEMTSAISEEHSSLNIIGERLEAETTERLRLMKEVNEHEIKYRELQKSTEKLEIELMFAKSDLISDFDDDIESDDAATNTYRLKYERVARELEFTKKRLQAQHEHDLEQLIGLKKQLEKKDVRLELELKQEKCNVLQRELEEVMFGAGSEEDMAQLKRQKLELDRRCKEQEEELDDMAGQIQLLEQANLRLEISLETIRKDARKETQLRDDELEEIRGSLGKKIRSLECQLEQEYEKNTLLLREKHELERRVSNLEEDVRNEKVADEAASQKIKRDLKKCKALLRDAQNQLERTKADSVGKALIRQLRNQLEDAESARSTAVKCRQIAETDLRDTQLVLEEAQRVRYEAEEKALKAHRDRVELQEQIDENEEELSELMKKYSSVVKQLSCEQTKTADLEIRICELESERKNFKDQIAELTSRLENVESIGESSSSVLLKRLELRNKELESKLELEQANRARMEVQLQRHKDSSEKLQQEINQSRSKEIHTQDAFKKAQKTIRELQQELHTGANKEQECLLKRKDLEKKLESIEAEACSTRADLRLALQRIADLQQAMEEGDSYHSDSENSDTSGESIESMRYSCQNNVPSKETSGLINGSNVNDSNALFCVEEGATITPRITVTSSIVANSKSIYNEYSESQSRTHLVNGDKSNKDPSSA
ncbi:unconventional myosin-XVIIIa isoform X6 [Wyeomyia smithii]|uniref:unconventional myosin-XVIIIa isoform X6 n=1 Tax=Wyeomyia smithii TaxID=174621 RepID=UPI0024681A04|nr:unconventional myosin-XVIIIa isoform X6 [Wyeomyia smithii]